MSEINKGGNFFSVDFSKFGKYVQDVRCLSDDLSKRLRIIFKNGYGISVIKGYGSYGFERGLYEVAPLNKDGGLCGALLWGDGCDDVEGYLSVEDVANYALKIAEIKE